MSRRCGECTLCCRLLPVPEFDKLAGVRCAHQRSHKGCAVYGHHPLSCRVWSCSWLSDDDAGDLSRPDRAHYVIDCMPDFIEIDAHDGHPAQKVPVIQIWIDPKYPDAHRDPALRAYIERRSIREGGMAALVRYDNERAIVLFPPSVTDEGIWHEEGSGLAAKEHTAAEIAAVLRAV